MMSPEEKIAVIEVQIADCESGTSNLIICPYCKAENWKPGTGPKDQREGLCCELFGAAVMAILDRQALDRQLEIVARLADKVAMN